MKKCKGAEKYKGIYPPKCNGGDPCDWCVKVYQLKCVHPVEHLMFKQTEDIFDYEITCSQCGADLKDHFFRLGSFSVSKIAELGMLVSSLTDQVSDLREDIKDLKMDISELRS